MYLVDSIHGSAPDHGSRRYGFRKTRRSSSKFTKPFSSAGRKDRKVAAATQAPHADLDVVRFRPDRHNVLDEQLSREARHDAIGGWLIGGRRVDCREVAVRLINEPAQKLPGCAHASAVRYH